MDPRTPDGRDPAEAWTRGVQLGALGRYAEAWAVLGVPVPRTDPGRDGPDLSAAGATVTTSPRGSLLVSAAASLHRQLGRHGSARELDAHALDMVALTATSATAPADPDWTEAVLDATLGLAADAIGHADVDTATRWLDDAARLLAEAGESHPWRAPIRLHWVRAELALLCDRHEEAQTAAASALTLSERAASTRHLAKSRLILGVARSATDPIAAATSLRSSLALSVPAGWRPLQWPAYLVLADLEADLRYLSAAGLVIRSIAADTPTPIAAQWLERSEVRRCLAAPDV